VKRWKKLPPGTQRDWRHVVDARAGPGTKAIKTTISSSNGKQSNSTTTSLSLVSHKRLSKPKKVLTSDEIMMGMFES